MREILVKFEEKNLWIFHAQKINNLIIVSYVFVS